MLEQPDPGPETMVVEPFPPHTERWQRYKAEIQNLLEQPTSHLFSLIFFFKYFSLIPNHHINILSTCNFKKQLVYTVYIISILCINSVHHRALTARIWSLLLR